jgi:hypothetical protein
MGDDDESALVRELRGLAGVGVRDDSGTFVVRSGYASIHVEYIGGSSTSLTLSAHYDAVARREVPAEVATAYRDRSRGPLRARRPLEIVLRPEMPADIEAKASGLSAEWQAGDPTFDGRVYVSTVTEDARVVGAVLVPEVRAGVLQLFDLGFRSVTIDGEDGRVVARVTEFASRTPRAGRGARAIEAFATVLGALPALDVVGRTDATAPYAGWTRAMKVIGILGWALNVGYAGGIAALIVTLCPSVKEDSLTVPCAVGVAAGIVAAVFLSKRYADAVGDAARGTSRAHDLASEARWASFGGISVAVFTVVFVLGTALATAR